MPPRLPRAIPRDELWRCRAGEWSGVGRGSYPGVATFRHRERLMIPVEPDGSLRSVLQRTCRDDGDAAGTALPLAAGVLLARGGGTLVCGCGEHSGCVEARMGTVAREGGGRRIDWVTVAHGNDDRLGRMGRRWWVGARDFRYEAHHATMRTPESRKQLAAALRRGERA